MVREAEKNDLRNLLQLYLHLHEDKIPENSQILRETWETIQSDSNHHIILNEVNGILVSSCVCVIIPNLTRNVRPYAFIENDCYKMMLLTGSKKQSTLNFYEKAGYNSTDKTAFIQWLE